MQEAVATLPDEIAQPLARTRPWLKFAAIMGFVGSGFAVIGGLFMLVGVSTLPAPSPAYAMPPHGLFVLLSLVYFFMAALYFVPSLLLFRYAASLDRIERDGDNGTLARALEHQRQFWKYIGICIIAVICLWVLTFIGLIVFAAVMAAHGMH